MKYIIFSLFLLSNLGLFNNSKAAYRVMGTGTQNCEVITLHNDIEEVRLLTISWVQGFLTGLNLVMSKQYHTIGNNISGKKIWEEILNYCNENPQYSLSKASESIFHKFNKQPYD